MGKIETIAQTERFARNSSLLNAITRTISSSDEQTMSEENRKDARCQISHPQHLTITRELEAVNASAANSLLEGLEETLTLHRLGLSPELTKSLGTTNCIESFMSQLASCTDKVDRWHNSDQILRWTASAAMDNEPRINRIRGHRYLKLLRNKLREIVSARSGMKSPADNLESKVEVK